MEKRIEIMDNAVREIIEVISKHNLTYKEMSQVLRHVELEIQSQPIPTMGNVLNSIARKWSCMSVKDKDVVLDLLCNQGEDSAGSIVEAIKKGECGSAPSLLVSM